MKIYSNTSFDKKWEILKTLKIQKLEKADFTYFVRFPLDQIYSNTIFDKGGGFWMRWNFNARLLKTIKTQIIFDKGNGFSNLWSLKGLKNKAFLVL